MASALSTKSSDAEQASPAHSEQTRWRSIDGAHHATQHARAFWQKLPAAVWQRWLLTLLIGWLGTALLVAALVWLGKALVKSGALAWEQPWLDQLTQTPAVSITRALSLDILADTPIVVAVTVVAAIIFVYRARSLSALNLLVGVLGCTALVFLGWKLWSRERPDAVLGGMLAPGRNSFPSGHVAHATVLWGLLGYYWIRSSPHRSERAVAVLLIAGLLALVVVGRLLTGAHWPSDLAGGLLISGTWLAVTIVAMRGAAKVARREGASERL